MPQAVSASSIAPLRLPTGLKNRVSPALPAGHIADIVDLHDFFVQPPATSLQEAKERLFREMPPKPDCTGMADWEVMQAMWNWQRMKCHVYDTVLFG